MADVPGKFYRATKVRTGVSPSSAGSIEGEPLPPVNPPGSSLNSVGLTMPSAFTVSNSPLTANGTIGVAGAGTVAQYIRGDGSLADFPETSGGGASVSYYLNGSVAQGTIGGVAYKEMNKVPIFGAGTDFTINANGYIASFITDAGDPNLLEIPGGNWNFETYFSSSSNGGTPTFYVELYKYNGTTFTLIASNSANPEFIAFGTIITAYFTTLAVPTTTLALTDRLAVRYYVTHSGRTITMHTEGPHLCQIITTFTTGLTALNGLTAQVQNFAVGTTGTDFNIASAVSTHTFNLPTASATNRGALSTSDWALFTQAYNDKINSAAVTGTTTKTLTLTQQDGGTITASWSDLNTDAVLSVFGRTGNVIAVSGDYTTAQVTESGNLYYTDARSRAALSFAAGSGAYNTSTGVITIPTNNNQITNGAGYITSAALAAYLPLTGGTLTGPLGGTSANFSSTLYVSSTATISYSSLSGDFGAGYTVGLGVGYSSSVAKGINMGWNTTLDMGFIGAVHNGTSWKSLILNPVEGSLLIGAAVDNGSKLQVQGAGTFTSSVTSTSFIRSGGTSSQFLKADGSVDSTSYGTGTVTSVTASSPLASSGGTTPNITIQQASGSQSGFLSSTDWTTFNSKQNALTNPVTGTGNTNYLSKFTSNGSTIGNSQVFDNGTNVGIGTNNPNAQMSGTVGLSIVNGSNAALGLSNGTNNWLNYLAGTTYRIWNNTSTEVMVFHLNGNIGIGSSAVDNGARLQVSGTSTFSNIITANSDIHQVSTGGLYWGAPSTYVIGVTGNTANGNLSFITGSTVKLTIASTGAATFSSSVSAASCSLSGTIASGGYSQSGDFGAGFTITGAIGISGKGINMGWNTTNDVGFIGTVHNGTNWKSLSLVPLAGAVMIGTLLDNGNKLRVNGTIFSDSSVTATSFFESSDATLKTLVEDNYQAKGIDSVVAKLYIKNGKEELGYFAQDLQGVLPSSVSKGSDGLLNLSYREVHTAKIAYLEEKIKQLEKKYEIN